MSSFSNDDLRDALIVDILDEPKLCAKLYALGYSLNNLEELDFEELLAAKGEAQTLLYKD